MFCVAASSFWLYILSTLPMRTWLLLLPTSWTLSLQLYRLLLKYCNTQKCKVCEQSLGHYNILPHKRLPSWQCLLCWYHRASPLTSLWQRLLVAAVLLCVSSHLGERPSNRKTFWVFPSVGISIYGFASPPRWLWGSKRSSTSDVFFSLLAFLVSVAGDSLFPLHLLLLLFKEIPSLHGCSDGPSRSTAVHNPGKISFLWKISYSNFE